MFEEMNGKAAIVTGGSKGIGAALAVRLDEAGVNVAIFDVDQEAGEAVAAAHDKVTFFNVDVASQTAVEDAVTEVAKRFGGLHMLVNNAGIAPPRTLENMADGDWEQVLDINLKGAFNLTRAAVPLMVEGGSIVNVSSVAGKNISMAAGMHYTTSKWGLIGFSRHMAYELAPRGIRVNIVCPGPTLTPLIEKIMDEKTITEATTNVPLGRWVMPDDIANAILFFLSPMSAMCAGAELIVDGGVLIGSGNSYDAFFKNRGSEPPERTIEYPDFSTSG